ncbi:MAG: hypothetical protein IKZ10_07525 [Akkermansia sp.]|nr:hypothetical protein [Akkermansia sp.]
MISNGDEKTIKDSIHRIMSMNLFRRRVLLLCLLSLCLGWGLVGCITQVSSGDALEHVGRKLRTDSTVTSCYESGTGSDRRIYAQVEATYRESRASIVSTCSIDLCSHPTGWPSSSWVKGSEEKRNYYILLTADEAKKGPGLNVSEPPASAPRVLTETEFAKLPTQRLNISQKRLDRLDSALNTTILRPYNYVYSSSHYLRRPLSYGLRAVDWPLTVAINAGTAAVGAVWFVVGGIPYLLIEQMAGEASDTSQPTE